MKEMYKIINSNNKKSLSIAVTPVNKMKEKCK